MQMHSLRVSSAPLKWREMTIRLKKQLIRDGERKSEDTGDVLAAME